MNEKLTKAQAERLADDLLAQQPANRLHELVKSVGRLFELRPLRHTPSRSPFVNPSAPAWGVVHRDTDTRG